MAVRHGGNGMGQLNVAALENVFFIGLRTPEAVRYSVPLQLLTEREPMLRLLAAHAPCIGTPDKDASAVAVANGLGLLAFALQHAISVDQASFDTSADNAVLHLYEADGYVQFGLTLRRIGEQAAPKEPHKRSIWRRRALERLYGETLRPRFEAAARAAGMPVRELWGQLPTGFAYYLDVWREESDAGAQIEDDYAFLSRELEAAVFGTASNPFARVPPLTVDPDNPQRQIPLKHACCLYYKWEGGDYCYTCPRIKESERERRRSQAGQEGGASA